MTHQIVICLEGGMDAKALALLRQAGQVIESSTANLPKNIGTATVLIVGVDVKVDRSMLERGKSINIIATPATGTDHIDLSEAEKRGITVLSLRGDTDFLRGVTATAELSFGLLLAIIRKIPSALQSVKEGKWKRGDFRGHSLLGKTLGVVGVGRLGTLMAQYGTAFGMKVIGCDPHPSPSSSCEYVTMKTLLAQSDVISLHVPLNDETQGMIGKKELKATQPGAILINTSRGKIVDEGAVLAALESGALAGYATDVLADELDSPQSSPLIAYAKTHDNLLITPHIGGMTEEARMATDRRIAEKIQKQIG